MCEWAFSGGERPAGRQQRRRGGTRLRTIISAQGCPLSHRCSRLMSSAFGVRSLCPAHALSPLAFVLIKCGSGVKQLGAPAGAWFSKVYGSFSKNSAATTAPLEGITTCAVSAGRQRADTHFLFFQRRRVELSVPSRCSQNNVLVAQVWVSPFWCSELVVFLFHHWNLVRQGFGNRKQIRC